MTLRPDALAVLALATLVATAAAQPRPRPDVSIVADADGVRAAGDVRLALRVVLPDGIHVQSNRPRDPLLIPTTVTATLPAGVRLVEVVYPPSTDFVQAGLAEPLAVFEHRFAIGVKLAVGADVAPGDLTVPVRLRYQACDERTCFPPSREDLSVSLRVVSAAVTPSPQFGELFKTLRFSR